ncbi:fibroblast growth factor receptor-like 1 [Haematobia irritans]|uniref:fibroblast growth factor receptor-like 1 n=1 Tax=Haematobia irritans TaxID=7368 RepID=UPI003F4F8FF9
MVSEIVENIGTLQKCIKLIILLLTIIYRGLGYSANGLFVDYADNTELIREHSGYNITLQCSTNGLIDETKDNNIKYLWYFKQCDVESASTTNCYHNNDGSDDWTQLPCEDNFCKSELQLKNVTEKYSGLYKCTVVPNAGSNLVDVKLVRTFHLDIKNISHKIPAFLDNYPLNSSASLGSQVVFQCRVYSEEYPTIKWFRRLPDLKFVDYESLHSIVYYNGRAYELLTTPREKPIGGDVYLSKLILNEVRSQDEGFYACVPITVRGHSIREAYLQIDPLEDEEFATYWSDYSEETVDLGHSDPQEFWLLFLMPVGLAILPLSVWLCYVVHKRCHRRDVEDPVDFSEEQMQATDQQRMLRS